MNESTEATIRWRMGKKSVNVDRPEPAFDREVQPRERHQDEEHEAHDGPAASALGTTVLIPTPSAVKQSMPTTTTSTNAGMSRGPCTL